MVVLKGGFVGGVGGALESALNGWKDACRGVWLCDRAVRNIFSPPAWIV